MLTSILRAIVGAVLEALRGLASDRRSHETAVELGEERKRNEHAEAAALAQRRIESVRGSSRRELIDRVRNGNF